MKRETTEERIHALREWLLEFGEVVNQIAQRVDILWEERQRLKRKAPLLIGDEEEEAECAPVDPA